MPVQVLYLDKSGKSRCYLIEVTDPRIPVGQKGPAGRAAAHTMYAVAVLAKTGRLRIYPGWAESQPWRSVDLLMFGNRAASPLPRGEWQDPLYREVFAKELLSVLVEPELGDFAEIEDRVFNLDAVVRQVTTKGDRIDEVMAKVRGEAPPDKDELPPPLPDVDLDESPLDSIGEELS